MKFTFSYNQKLIQKTIRTGYLHQTQYAPVCAFICLVTLIPLIILQATVPDCILAITMALYCISSFGLYRPKIHHIVFADVYDGYDNNNQVECTVEDNQINLRMTQQSSVNNLQMNTESEVSYPYQLITDAAFHKSFCIIYSGEHTLQPIEFGKPTKETKALKKKLKEHLKNNQTNTSTIWFRIYAAACVAMTISSIISIIRILTNT